MHCVYCWDLLDCHWRQPFQHLPVLLGWDVPNRDRHADQPCLHSLQRWKIRYWDWIHTGLELRGLCRWDIRACGWSDCLHFLRGRDLLCRLWSQPGQHVFVLLCWHLLGRHGGFCGQLLPAMHCRLVQHRAGCHNCQRVPALLSWYVLHWDWIAGQWFLHGLLSRGVLDCQWGHYCQHVPVVLSWGLFYWNWPAD